MLEEEEEEEELEEDDEEEEEEEEEELEDDDELRLARLLACLAGGFAVFTTWTASRVKLTTLPSPSS